MGTLTVDFISAPNGDDPSANGVSTGVGSTYGTITSGAFIPFGAATQFALLTQPLPGKTTVVLEFNDATLAQDSFQTLTIVHGATTVVLNAADADFSVSPGAASIWTWTQDGTVLTTGNAVEATLFSCVDDSEFNCDCETVSPYDTLVNVRKRMLIRLGYPNQITSPPPGMALLIDEFVRGAQKLIYRQVQRAARRTERFYRWTMVPGVRYYGLLDNDDCCDFKLDPEKVTWVGFEDLNKAWYRLDDGIPPEYYTRANISFGWPTRFEIRSCIEIFPAPQAAYTLWIKGDFGLSPLVADSDRCTIDDEAVFLLALGNAKTHYGQKDATAVMKQAGNYIMGVVSGSHGTKRYVPRSESDNPLTPPRFLPLGTDQA